MKSATTASTIKAATEGLLFDDEGGCALDLDHVDARALLEDLVLEVRARRPFFAADPDASAVDVDPAENDGLAPDERVRAGSRDRGQAYVPARDRTQERERGNGAGDEDEQRDPGARAECGGQRGGESRERDRPEEEHAGREDLADGECDGDQRPQKPTGHVPHTVIRDTGACKAAGRRDMSQRQSSRHVAAGHVAGTVSETRLRETCPLDCPSDSAPSDPAERALEQAERRRQRAQIVEPLWVVRVAAISIHEHGAHAD